MISTYFTYLCRASMTDNVQVFVYLQKKSGNNRLRTEYAMSVSHYTKYSDIYPILVLTTVFINIPDVR